MSSSECLKTKLSLIKKSKIKFSEFSVFSTSWDWSFKSIRNLILLLYISGLMVLYNNCYLFLMFSKANFCLEFLQLLVYSSVLSKWLGQTILQDLRDRDRQRDILEIKHILWNCVYQCTKSTTEMVNFLLRRKFPGSTKNVTASIKRVNTHLKKTVTYFSNDFLCPITL